MSIDIRAVRLSQKLAGHVQPDRQRWRRRPQPLEYHGQDKSKDTTGSHKEIGEETPGAKEEHDKIRGEQTTIGKSSNEKLGLAALKDKRRAIGRATMETACFIGLLLDQELGWRSNPKG
jgi:hypothetical protein